MKLSDDTQFMSMMNSFLITPEGMNAVSNVLGKASQLEADSQMLSDLIEMMTNDLENISIGYSDYRNKATFYVVEKPDNVLAEGSTPRLAIQAAIYEWRKK